RLGNLGHVTRRLAIAAAALCRRSWRTYLISTVAPASSSCFLIFAASSLLTPSLTGLGAASTRSLASLRPSWVNARTSLITLTFFSPIVARMTSNSVFSAATSAAGAPPPAAATATGAAAETPHFSSSILASSAAWITVRADRSSTSFVNSAIWSLPLNLGVAVRVCPARISLCAFALSRAVLLGVSRDDPRQLPGRRLQQHRQLGR